jgi:hypothetical protein
METLTNGNSIYGDNPTLYNKMRLLQKKYKFFGRSLFYCLLYEIKQAPEGELPWCDNCKEFFYSKYAKHKKNPILFEEIFDFLVETGLVVIEDETITSPVKVNEKKPSIERRDIDG